MGHVADLIERITELSARVADGEASCALAREMEDLLCDGYAAALGIDARVRRLERRCRELAVLGVADSAVVEQLSDLERRRSSWLDLADATRRELAALRELFVGLGGADATAR